MRFTAYARIATPLAACTLLVAASAPWTDKDAAQWTSADAERILSDSPWSKQIKPSLDRSAEDGVAGPLSRGGGGQNGPLGDGSGVPGAGRGQIGGGGIGNPGGYGGGGYGGANGRGGIDGNRYPGAGRPSFNLTVRWASALPVRLALARLKSDIEKPAAPDEPQKYYVLEIAGLGQLNGYRGQNGPDNPPDANGPDLSHMPRDPEQLKRQIFSSSRLIRKGKDPINAEDAKVSESPDGSQVIDVLFPKSNAIGLEDKEVSFESRLGPMQIERRFRLKDMMYKGALEL